MERKYKFRGYDIVGEKGWVYGDLTHNQKVTTTGLQPRTMVYGYEVAPESVGLFTGLVDITGREIYEGDIVKLVSLDTRYFGKEMICSIVYDNELCCFDFQSEDRQRCMCTTILDADITVIGNVYEDKSEYGKQTER